ncbi:N-acetylmuramoyl-L-alanine amidase [Hellea balneolensis]|uniref:N-acetylmuramoyl-L-alanine amidase n=1 Tax=Hellea balneolensis TaxID=287478 RepID=UPI0003F8F0F4|nr:N-acetylmuramoyl-L-alanine amidase [Hellea balneolensis]
MNITQVPSPNFDDRTLPISLLILHYTGMQSGKAALERMCDSEAKVSAHYMVEEDGHVFQLVDEDKRAWHAGVSEWQGESNINSNSIGIEIVNGGHDWPRVDGSLPPFPDVQINAVIALSKDIMKRHSNLTVLGHSDIAPTRKIDPGEHFPWAGLAAAGLGYWPNVSGKDRRILFEPGTRDRGVAILQSGLAHIGYGARVTGVLDEASVKIIEAFQRRYRPDQIDGVVDIHTMEIVKALSESIPNPAEFRPI